MRKHKGLEKLLGKVRKVKRSKKGRSHGRRRKG